MIKAYIHPVLHKYSLSANNRKNLISSIARLLNTDSTKEVLEILHDLKQKYKVKKSHNRLFIDEMEKRFQQVA